ncbi:hypothetical protein [Mucilaginibacter sp.]|uniref:hypothetical protein n=1 Tax=Mucilaginibacter sp. TaxID=1882438 RepID=UPI0035BBF67D
MQNIYKITLTALVAVMLFQTSCKKSDNVTPAKADASTGISKELALKIARGLSSNLGIIPSAKVASAKTPVIMDNLGCGTVLEQTNTNQTVVNGDTTVSYLGNKLVTSLCNVAGYKVLDTLTTTRKGKGFLNTYKVTVDYDVVRQDPTYSFVGLTGFSSTTEYNSKLSANNDVIENNQLYTAYTWSRVLVQRLVNGVEKPTFLQGKVDFACRLTGRAAGDKSTDGTLVTYSGYMEILGSNSIMVSFYQGPGKPNKEYLIDATTGAVKEQ